MSVSHLSSSHARLLKYCDLIGARFRTRSHFKYMTSTSLVCWGAAGQTKVLNEFLPALGYRLVALFDNDTSIRSPLSQVPLVGDWSAFQQWREEHTGPIACIVAIGGGRGADRMTIQLQLADAGLHPVSLVHPTAFVAANAMIGAGSQILAMSAVCAEARLGQACIVNTRASVDHQCVLGDGVHVGPGATLCGEVRIDSFAFVGAGATILPRVRIGRSAVVGAGAVVARDVAAGTCVVGIPARTQAAERSSR
jgi:sugar O-acyltransferase (sialic acid O-acetyltransferase NeuD family)